MRWITAAILLLTASALARPPPGTDMQSAAHLWWECHVQPVNKVVCCRESDGHILGDHEWRAVEKTDGTRVYQVRVDGTWYDVPAEVVINDFRRCGPDPEPAHRTMAKIWYAPSLEVDRIVDIHIYCFIAGTMY